MQARIAVLAAALIAAAVVLSGRSVAQPAPAQQQLRWEYASFVRSDEAAAWQSPQESHVAADVYGVYERLGGKLSKEKVANTEVLNEVGCDGWELVAATHLPGGTLTFWFKRPAQ